MAKTPEAKVKFSIFNEEFRAGITEINKDTTRLRKEFKLQEEQMKHTTTTTGKLEHNIKRLSKEQENVRQKIELTKKQLAEAKEYYGENSEEARQLENQLLDLQISEQKIENAIADSNAAIEQQGELFVENQTGIDKYRENLAKAGESITDFGTKMQDVGKDISSFGKSYSTKVTAPIVAGAGLAYKAFETVDDAFNDIRQTTGKTGDEFEKLKDSFRNVYKTVSDSSDDVSNVLSALNVATGATGEELENLTRLTLDYAKVNKTEAAESAKVLGRLMNGLEVDVSAMPGVMDKLTKAAQLSGIGVNQLTEYIIDAGPAFEEMGFDLDRSIALFASFEKAGANPKEVLSSLNIVMTRMAREGATNAEEAFRKLMDEIKDAPDILTATDIAADAFGAKVGGKIADDIRAGHFEVDEWVKALEDAEGTVKNTADETETFSEKLANLRNKTVLALEPMGGALVDAFESALNAAEPLIEKIESGAQAFADMTEEEQQTIIKTVALVAAIGPASIVVGNLATAFGGAAKLGGGLLSLLGKAGGGGLIGRMGLLGVAGPVGLAIAGITGLTIVVKELTDDSLDLHDITTETADRFTEQADTLEELVEKYDELELKSKLTTDQFGRMIDIQKELEQTQNPARVAELKDEYEYLREKSGMTNDEIEEMIGLNNDILEQSPDVEQSFTNKGNAVLESTDAVHEYIQSLRDMAFEELKDQKEKALINEKELTQQIKNDKEEINRLDEKQNELIELRDMPLSEVEDRIEEINKLMQDGTMEASKRNELEEELDLLLQAENGLINETIERLIDKKTELRENINLNEDELSKLEEINVAIADNLLAEVDINFEKGKGLDKLDQELDKLQKNREELIEQHKAGEIDNDIYNDKLDLIDESIRKHESVRDRIEEETGYQSEQNRKLDLQNRKIENAGLQYRNNKGEVQKVGLEQDATNKKIDVGTSKAFNLTQEMRKEAIKKVDVKDYGSAQRITAEAGKGVTKTVTIKATGATNLGVLGSIVPRYAKGTGNHPGGPALVGEEGPELIKQGRSWSLADLGMYNLQRGAQVFTADQTKKILSSIKRIPAYANGTGVSEQMARDINRTSSNLASSRERVINSNTNIQIESSDVILDGNKVGHVIWKPVKENIDRSNFRKRKR